MCNVCVCVEVEVMCNVCVEGNGKKHNLATIRPTQFKVSCPRNSL